MCSRTTSRSIRLAVKLHFLVGVARRIAETNGTVDMPPVRSALGLLAAQATMVEGLVSGMEAQGEQRGPYFVPSRQLLYAAQVVTQELYPQFINAVRELAGGGTIMLPSSAADFGNAEIRRIIERTILSPATDSEGRVRLFRLAWDAIGSEFASRHVQDRNVLRGSCVRHARQRLSDLRVGAGARNGRPHSGTAGGGHFIAGGTCGVEL